MMVATIRTCARMIALAWLSVAPALADSPRPSIAMHGAPALPDDFDHWPYANPEAPKGGRLTLAYLGSFDSLNPFNVKALSTSEGLIGNVYQSLMARSHDEPFTLYPQIAKTIETDEERDYVEFQLDPRARFSNGAQVTAADVAFTFELLKAKGRPQQRSAFALVKSVATPDDETIRFEFPSANDREMPLTLALMPVFSRARTDAAAFQDQTLELPIATGPYRVASVDPGQRLVLKRDPNFWGKDLPTSRGLYNFDEIRIDYYRDASAMFAAFAAGLYDFRIEDDATRWHSDYDFLSRRDGRVRVETLPVRLPKGMAGFAFNTRRAIFADAQVREALASMFDFEWADASFFAGAYVRSRSFFNDSELSSADRPASDAERQLLAPFRGAVRTDVLEGRWRPTVSDGSGRDRAIARRALVELGEAGYALRGGVLTDGSARPLAFEITVKSPPEERLALAFSASLARIGVKVQVRLVDSTQFQRRRDKFDFDMMPGFWAASPSPGSEQRSRWGSGAADMEGSYDLAGAASPVIDAMISALLAATDRETFIAATRALDRVLLSAFYVVPLYYARDQWLAYSIKLGRPASTPLFGVDLATWWRREP